MLVLRIILLFSLYHLRGRSTRSLFERLQFCTQLSNLLVFGSNSRVMLGFQRLSLLLQSLCLSISCRLLLLRLYLCACCRLLY